MATTQEFIQPMAQANTPFLANNGNPNTVYNTAATPFGGQAVVAQPTGVPNPAEAWYDISPFGGSNIRQNWRFAPASTALPPSAYADPAARFWANRTAMAPAQFSLADSGAMQGGANPFIPIVPGDPANPGDDVVVDIHPHDPNHRPEPVNPPLQTAPPLPHTPPNAQFPGAVGGGLTQQQLGAHAYLSTPSGVTRTNSLGSVIDGISSLVDQASSGLGFNGRTGGFDVMQFLDAVTEVVLPGDFYRQNTGTWNTQQVAKSILNTVFPGLGKLGAWLARTFRDKLPEGIRNWLDKNDLADLVEESYNVGGEGNYMNVPQTGGGSPFLGGGLGGWSFGPVRTGTVSVGMPTDADRPPTFQM